MTNTSHQAFKIKDVIFIKYFLRLKVINSKQCISLCQKKYCIDLLAGSRLLDSKIVTTPSDPSDRFFYYNSNPYEYIPEGSLAYFYILTPPDQT